MEVHPTNQGDSQAKWQTDQERKEIPPGHECSIQFGALETS